MHLNNTSKTSSSHKSKPGETIDDKKNKPLNTNLSTMNVKKSNKGLFKTGL